MSGTFAISKHPLDPAAISQIAAESAHGATVTFEGIVRETADDGRRVSGLAYEAHEAMAIETFAAIAEEARTRFGPCGFAIVHRVGELCVGEVAVIVAVAAAHRASAFDACRYAVDELKARAPIWKKEVYADGSGVWKENARTAAPSAREA
jgi:molybdopterin synthase catalytic subunit